MPENIPIHRLKDMPVFGGLREDIVKLILEGSHYVEREAGEPFFLEGERGDSSFIVESGSAALFKVSSSGEQYKIRAFLPGECFGAMALLGVYPRSGIVKAMEPCRAVEIKADQLFSVYQADPEQYVLIFMNMARDLSRRLRDTDDQLVECLEERLQSGLKTIP
ncbi:cAMP-binding domain of CRP or a regulatory subunit of cAMP-dependent protein kinases [Amphritea atlantica]|uniref:cAMP-binding domain of CRP or a regulatory subunit of cAMP-dependent protein kinases n=1 Tax=Amphritea atlantica TaxID=355243 RepID=A0A1H9FRE8_9GAMM|nr:Crp/Fnr family transcriptional regulator [Amphritea atlantica]SEQ40083.1 cAMP-binding domain of CRP or a regulatory subunit of cAMP-dependent protein kinases [Amphritea atlantica]